MLAALLDACEPESKQERWSLMAAASEQLRQAVRAQALEDAAKICRDEGAAWRAGGFESRAEAITLCEQRIRNLLAQPPAEARPTDTRAVIDRAVDRLHRVAMWSIEKAVKESHGMGAEYYEGTIREAVRTVLHRAAEEGTEQGKPLADAIIRDEAAVTDEWTAADEDAVRPRPKEGTDG